MIEPDARSANDADAPPPDRDPTDAAPVPVEPPAEPEPSRARDVPEAVAADGASSPRKTRGSRAVLTVVGTFALLLFGFCFLCTPFGELLVVPLQFCGALGLGWIRFLRTNIPQMTWSAGHVVFGIATAALLVAGIHGTGRRVVAARRAGAGRLLHGADWSARRTLTYAGGLLLAFAVCLASVGIVRQFGLAAASEAPWTSEGGYRAGYQRSQSRSQLKQIGLALHNHHDVEKSFPPGATFDAATGRALHGWIAPLLPYLDQRPLHARIDWSLPWNEGRNVDVFKTELSLFQAPAAFDTSPDTTDARGFAVTHYAANAWILGGDRRVSFRHVTDGASNTLLIGEAAVQPKAWGHPRNWRDPALGLDTSPHGFGMPGVDVVQFTLVDGAVIALSKKTDPRVLRALATPRGGDDATLPP